MLPVSIEHINNGNVNKQRDEKGNVMQSFIAQWEPLAEGRHEIRIQLDGEFLSPQDILSSEALQLARSEGNLTSNTLIVNVLDLSAVNIIGLRDGGAVGVRHEFQCKIKIKMFNIFNS